MSWGSAQVFLPPPVFQLPREGLYPWPWFSVTEAYGRGTLVLKGPKHLSSLPGVKTPTPGSMVALKATLMPSEGREGLLHGLPTLAHVLHLSRARLVPHLSAGGLCRPAGWRGPTALSAWRRCPPPDGTCGWRRSSSPAGGRRRRCSPRGHRSAVRSVSLGRDGVRGGGHLLGDRAAPDTYGQRPAESGWCWTGLPRDRGETAPPAGTRGELQVSAEHRRHTPLRSQDQDPIENMNPACSPSAGLNRPRRDRIRTGHLPSCWSLPQNEAAVSSWSPI